MKKLPSIFLCLSINFNLFSMKVERDTPNTTHRSLSTTTFVHSLRSLAAQVSSKHHVTLMKLPKNQLLFKALPKEIIVLLLAHSALAHILQKRSLPNKGAFLLINALNLSGDMTLNHDTDIEILIPLWPLCERMPCLMSILLQRIPTECLDEKNERLLFFVKQIYDLIISWLFTEKKIGCVSPDMRKDSLKKIKYLKKEFNIDFNEFELSLHSNNTDSSPQARLFIQPFLLFALLTPNLIPCFLNDKFQINLDKPLIGKQTYLFSYLLINQLITPPITLLLLEKENLHNAKPQLLTNHEDTIIWAFKNKEKHPEICDLIIKKFKSSPSKPALNLLKGIIETLHDQKKIQQLMFKLRVNINDGLKAVSYYGGDYYPPSSERESVKLLAYAVEQGNLPFAQMLLKLGANLDVLCYRKTPLLIAAIHQNDSLMVKELIAWGIDINVNFGKKNNNALMYALSDKASPLSLDIIKLLIQALINLNHQNTDEDTALIAGCYLNQEPWDEDQDLTELNHFIRENILGIKELINAGAKLNMQNNAGNTALMVACNAICPWQNQETQLWSMGQFSIIKELIVNSADLNISNNNGDTALIIACRKGYHDIANLLIDAGANITIINRAGQNALDWAYRQFGYNAAITLKLRQQSERGIPPLIKG